MAKVKKKKKPTEIKGSSGELSTFRAINSRCSFGVLFPACQVIFFSHYLDVKKRMLLSLYFWNFKIIIYIRIVVKLWKEISENERKKKSTQITD